MDLKAKRKRTSRIMRITATLKCVPSFTLLVLAEEIGRTCSSGRIAEVRDEDAIEWLERVATGSFPAETA